MINGREANEMSVWQPVTEGQGFLQGRGRFDLTAGAPFAYLYATLQRKSPDGEVEPRYGRTVVALVGDKVCGVGLHRVWAAILVVIPSAEQEPGCGQPGTEVRFAVDGFAVPDTIAWRAGAHEGFTHMLDASPDAALAGPPFAYFTFEIDARPEGHVVEDQRFVEARVGGMRCGIDGAQGPATLVVAVAPDEIAPGCGRPGATVSFHTDGKNIGAAAWQPGFHAGPDTGTAVTPAATPAATPTTGGSNRISPPDTGSGGLRR